MGSHVRHLFTDRNSDVSPHYTSSSYVWSLGSGFSIICRISPGWLAHSVLLAWLCHGLPLLCYHTWDIIFVAGPFRVPITRLPSLNRTSSLPEYVIYTPYLARHIRIARSAPTCKGLLQGLHVNGELLYVRRLEQSHETASCVTGGDSVMYVIVAFLRHDGVTAPVQSAFDLHAM